MRITIIGGPFQPWPPAPCGSVERLWHGMAREFAAAGHQVTAICQRHPSQSVAEDVDGIHFVRKWRFSRTRSIKRDLILDMAYSMRVLALCPPADIIIPHTFWLPYLLPRLRKSAGRVVAHVQRFPKGQIPLYLRTACITTVSQTIADAIVAQCPAAEPLVRVVPNPVHTDVFSTPSQPRRFGPSAKILYTGRVHPEKGLELLIEAYVRLRQRYPELQLDIMGPSEVSRGGGGPDFVQKLQSLARGASVQIKPPLDNIAQLAQALQKASYYCYPSIAGAGEASPVAPLEAMASGLAPVVSNLGQFRDYLRSGHNGLVFDHEAGDPAGELAAKLEQLISDPDLCRTMGNAAMKTAAGLNYSAVARMYLSLFASLVDADHSPAAAMAGGEP